MTKVPPRVRLRDPFWIEPERVALVDKAIASRQLTLPQQQQVRALFYSIAYVHRRSSPADVVSNLMQIGLDKHPVAILKEYYTAASKPLSFASTVSKTVRVVLRLQRECSDPVQKSLTALYYVQGDCISNVPLIDSNPC